MSAYHELTLLCPERAVGAMADALEALGALSVSVEDADAMTPAEDALFGEPGMPAPKEGWRRSRLVALFEQEVRARDAAHALQGQDFFDGCTMTGITPLVEQDWVRLTQSQFAPVEITPTFWIVPSWHAPPEQAQQVMRLDPGLAFGTGTHPTTRMCLRWIARHPGIARVLDYGCGSGILAIGAALHGAGLVQAVDIDPAAVDATRANAHANGVGLVCGLPESVVGASDLVLANILASPLKVLAPLLWGHVAPGGHLVLAGILTRQAEELRLAYQSYCTLEVADEEDGWILMTAQR